MRHATSLSGTPKMPYSPAPELGEHTDEILREFEFSDDEIEDLRREVHRMSTGSGPSVTKITEKADCQKARRGWLSHP